MIVARLRKGSGTELGLHAGFKNTMTPAHKAGFVFFSLFAYHT